jgi:predicted nucleic acid-binding OB-fold protein
MTDTKKVPLAELLLRRKELNALLDERVSAQQSSVCRDHIQRLKINDEIDQVTGRISRVSKGLLEKETNYYAHQRRLADSVVQQANWTAEVVVAAYLMSDEIEPAEGEEKDGSASVKLAELLVRRKELGQRLRTMPSALIPSSEDLYQEINERIPISKGLGDLVEKVQRRAPSDLKTFKARDALQRKLREVDAKIQRANWDTEVTVPKTVLSNFSMTDRPM